jgi:hypothetical protein
MDLETIKLSIVQFKNDIVLARNPNPGKREKDRTLLSQNLNSNGNNSNPNGNPRQVADASKPHCKICFALFNKIYNNHQEATCKHKDGASRLNATFNSSKDNKGSSNYLILDSGASAHMIGDVSLLLDYTSFVSPRAIILGDKSIIKAIGRGTMIVKSQLNGKMEYFPFYNTLLVPKLDIGLISMPVLMQNGSTIHCLSNHVKISSDGKIVVEAHLDRNNLLRISGTPLKSNIDSNVILQDLKSEYAQKVTLAEAVTDGKWFLLWHRRLGHIGKSTLLKTVPLVSNLDLKGEIAMDPCDVCVVANAKRAHHPSSASKSSHSGELIHMDHGILTVPTINGETSFLLMVDDSNHWTELCLSKSLTADEALSHFKKLEAVMLTEQEKSIGAIKSIRSDEHGAFQGSFQTYMDSRGIKHQLTVRYEHEQAGCVERMMQTIGSRHRSQMVDGSVPLELAGYSLSYSAYITNRIYTTTEDKTPFEKRFGTKPDMKSLRIFYCPAVVTIPKELQRKDQPFHGIRCRYLGPCTDHAADYFIEVDSHRIITSNAATFFEDWKSNTTINMKDFEIEFNEPERVHDPDFVPEIPQAAPVVAPTNIPDAPAPISAREARANRRNLAHVNVSVPLDVQQTSCGGIPLDVPRASGDPPPSQEGKLHNNHILENDPLNEPNPFDLDASGDPLDAYFAFSSLASGSDIPRNLKEALRLGSERNHWIDAISTELNAHRHNGTWTTIKRRSIAKKTIKCRWVFSKKYNHDGTLNKYKARLVAKGFTQRYGLDFTETFAPTMALKSFRTLVAMAAANRKRLFHADVPTAFIRSELEEKDVIMEPPELPPDDCLPPGFSPFQSDDACLLIKSLYGLKQSPRTWFNALKQSLLDLGFTQCANDPCIFVLNQDSSQLTIGVYVDDLLYFGDEDLIESIMASLKAQFNITLLGLATHFLGIHINQDGPPGTISIDQNTYISQLLSDFKITKLYPAHTPLRQDYHRLLQIDQQEQDSQPASISTDFTPPVDASYNTVLGKIMYAMVATRPDLCTPVGVLSRYLNNPRPIHWTMLMDVLYYLASNPQMSLNFKYDPNQSLISNLTPQVWTDADYAKDPVKSRSISGFVITLCGAAISWHSKLQSTVAQSTAEAEFIAANLCARIVVWIRQLLQDLGVKLEGPTIINEDNQSCIAIAKNPQINEKTAHFQTKFHYLHEKIADKTILLQYCKTADQVADMFTKGLARVHFERFRSMLGLAQLGGSVA